MKKLITTAIAFLAMIVALTGIAAAQGMTWHVLAGGETHDMAIKGEAFYPGAITINAGDTDQLDTWRAHLVHTISFLSGAQAPDPGSNASMKPAGGPTYNGTGFANSGVITPGMSYSLKLMYTKVLLC